jgi:heme/copper-type cytochrome/quinol oxidase subunit 2
MPFRVPSTKYSLLGVAVHRLDLDSPLPLQSMPQLPATILFWIAVACCLVAQVLIVRSVVAARALPAVRPELPRARGSVEVMWAIVPAVALAVLLFFTWRAIETNRATRAAAATSAVAAQ